MQYLKIPFFIWEQDIGSTSPKQRAVTVTKTTPCRWTLYSETEFSVEWDGKKPEESQETETQFR